MSGLLSKRNAIYGFCAIWIVLFHVYRKIGMPYIPVITNFVGIGNMAVDVFVFFSGLCLSLSAQKHEYLTNGWKDFFRRRFNRIIVPYLLICIPYYSWYALFEATGSIRHRAIQFIANLSSATFWIYGTQTTWYVYGIAFLCLLFPVLFCLVARSKTKLRVCLVLCFVIFAIISSYTPILKNSMILWARIPIFLVGIIAGCEKTRIHEPNKKQIIVSAIVFIALGFLTSVSEIRDDFTIPQVYRLLIYIPMTIALVTLFSRYVKSCKILDLYGEVSLEVYLIHITLLHPIMFYEGLKAISYAWYVLLPIAALLLSIAVAKLERVLVKQEA